MSQPDSALIFLSGDHPGPATLGQVLPLCQRRIAADGGWDVARSLGVLPDTLIGDMDSVRDFPVTDGGMEGSPRIIRHPVDKDFTDTELALDLAWKEGCGRTVLFGGGGGRLDHLLALQALFQRPTSPDRWYTGYDEVILIKGDFRAALPAGTVLSLFPLGQEPCRARSYGLKWPLDSLSWGRGDFGLSNVVTAGEIRIDPQEGRFLLVRQLREGETICPLGRLPG